jgi:hypothetical protein
MSATHRAPARSACAARSLDALRIAALSTFLAAALASAASAQSADYCETFDNCQQNGWTALTASPNVTFNVPAGGPSGSGCYLRASDQPGGSAIAASPATVAAWNATAGSGTFCWDYQIEYDGQAANPPFYNALIVEGPAGKRFQFVLAVGVVQGGANAGWRRICAPIAPLTLGGAPPSNVHGAWVPVFPAVAADWPSVATAAVNLVFPVDLVSNPAEVVGIDDVCVTGRRTAVNKDLCNGTGQTATGVEWLVEGVFTLVDSSVMGPFNGFVVLPAGANTRFVWSGASVPAGYVVQVGVEVAVPSLKILGVFWKNQFGTIGCAPQVNAAYRVSPTYGIAGVVYTNDVSDCLARSRRIGPASVEFYSEAPPPAALIPTGIAQGLRVPLSVQTYGPSAEFELPPNGRAAYAAPIPPAGANWAVLVFDVGDDAGLSGGCVTRDFVLMAASEALPADLIPGFTVSAAAGPAPLVVSFDDATLAASPFGLQFWTWDFDGDGFADSFSQNATFVYGAPGDYDVTLTVGDGNGIATLTVVAAIRVGGNDECVSAQLIAAGTTLADNLSATTSAATGSCGAMTNDVWFDLVVPCTGSRLRLDTCGSTFDTVLAVFDACGGAQLACNDDAASGACAGSAASHVELGGLAAGQQLKIAVGGAGGARGAIVLNASFGVGFSMSYTAGVAFAMDACGGAPGGIVLQALTLHQGVYPAGWLFGVDMPLLEFFNLLQFGYPFLAVLDGAGAAHFSIPNLVMPTGLTVYGVAVEFAPNGAFVGASSPTSLTF